VVLMPILIAFPVEELGLLPHPNVMELKQMRTIAHGFLDDITVIPPGG